MAFIVSLASSNTLIVLFVYGGVVLMWVALSKSFTKVVVIKNSLVHKVSSLRMLGICFDMKLGLLRMHGQSSVKASSRSQM